MAATAGAVALPDNVSAQAATPQTVAEAAPLSLRNVSQFPGLSPRGGGWLRFLWEKATTRDDWSAAGAPASLVEQGHRARRPQLWPVDRSYSAYGLLLMADQTPAWREVYTRKCRRTRRPVPHAIGAPSIGLRRSVTTRSAPTIRRRSWPQIPASAARQVQPLRLDREWDSSHGACSPIRSLRTDTCFSAPGSCCCWPRTRTSRATTSGRGRSATGVPRRNVRVGHAPHRRTARIAVPRASRRAALREHENLGVLQRRWRPRHAPVRQGVRENTHPAFENFIGYTRENYMKVGSDGKLQSITSYYDPIEKFHFGANPAAGLLTAHLIQPQNPELGRLLYDGAANTFGWRNGTGDVRANPTGLVMARGTGRRCRVRNAECGRRARIRAQVLR